MHAFPQHKLHTPQPLTSSPRAVQTQLYLFFKLINLLLCATVLSILSSAVLVQLWTYVLQLLSHCRRDGLSFCVVYAIQDVLVEAMAADAVRGAVAHVSSNHYTPVQNFVQLETRSNLWNHVKIGLLEAKTITGRELTLEWERVVV